MRVTLAVFFVVLAGIIAHVFRVDQLFRVERSEWSAFTYGRMRRYKNGQWEYRDMTEEEAREDGDMIAW